MSAIAGTGFPVTYRRVVRGGSWNNNQANARAAARNWNNPNNRNNNLGFRVVCSSHIATVLLRRTLSGMPAAGVLRALQPLPAMEALPALAADHGLRPEAQGF